MNDGRVTGDREPGRGEITLGYKRADSENVQVDVPKAVLFRHLTFQNAHAASKDRCDVFASAKSGPGSKEPGDLVRQRRSVVPESESDETNGGLADFGEDVLLDAPPNSPLTRHTKTVMAAIAHDADRVARK